MAHPGISVEEVSGRAAFRRFVELPHVLFREEPRWSAPLASWDKRRLDAHRNPFFEDGDAAYLLLRRRGTPAGRITAHVAADNDEAGWFGFYDVVDDPACAAELVEAAAEWLRERGCTTMTGPVSFTADEEAGVLIDGFDVPGATGRAWHPPWYADGLRGAGLTELDGSHRRSWRLPATGPAPLPASADVQAPPVIGAYRDSRLLIAGPPGSVVAVPDLSSVPGASAWQLAKRAKAGDWEGCVILRCDGEPAALVPALCAAAGEAGYSWVLAPWTPNPADPPEAVHALFTLAL